MSLPRRMRTQGKSRTSAGARNDWAETDRANADSLIANAEPKSVASEAYRTLRTNIQFSSLDLPLRTLAVTSAGPGEGKSTIAANLAIVIAQAEHKCILVDCDLRKPVQHHIWGLSSRRGLTSVLLGHAQLSDVLCETPVPGLSVLPCGPKPPNPAELLNSQAMERLVAELKERADWVIFDAPPTVAVTDAAILGRKVDGCLLVISASGVPREVAIQAKESLLAAKANLLGVVLNRVQFSSGHGYYYYYYDDGEKTS